MNEKFNKNAKADKFTSMLGMAVRLIVIDPLHFKLQNMIKYLAKFEHLFCPKVGAQTHVCPLLFCV